MGQENVKREWADSVFRMMFKEKKALLSLYNAVAKTNYTDENELEIKTLENAVYMARKNDLAFIFRMDLHLYEHQSTVIPNMPLRFLQYISQVVEKEYATIKIYSRSRIMLPPPTFIVFYNGNEEQPERKILRLSDSYVQIGAQEAQKTPVNLELVVLQLNINDGYNEELKKACSTLQDYMHYCNLVKQYKKTMELKDAVNQAVDECIRNGIQADFFRRNKAEVKTMSIYEFDQDEYDNMLREEGREEGREEMQPIIDEQAKRIAEKDKRIAELEAMLAVK